MPILGIITLLVGFAYTALGLTFLALMDYAADQQKARHDPQAVKAVLMTIGIIFALQGLVAMVAGAGVLLRRRWSRILIYILAVITIIWGVLFSGIGIFNPKADGYLSFIVVGVAQFAFGILASMVLIKNATEIIDVRV